MRLLLFTLSLTFSLLSTIAFAQQHSASETSIGTLLDNPDTAAILEKHLPGFTENSQIGMARGFTLVALKSFAPDMITDEALAKIDIDLQALEADK